jgi:hypothetical protein
MPLDRTSEFLDLSETANLWAGKLMCSENGLVVQVGELETVPVIRAASCLLELAEGDTVLLYGRYPRVYAIAVLSRAGGINCVLSPIEGTSLAIHARDIEINAQHSFVLCAPKAHVVLTEITLQSRSAQIMSETVTLVGGILRTIARTIENTADRMTAAFGSRTTQIHDVDILKSNTSMTTVEGISATRTGSMTITAKHDVRVDAERISLG